MILLFALGTGFLSSSSFATVIHVPGDYATIQEGIDASTDGDTVLVQPGTYVENINFNGHNVVLASLFLTTGDASYISSTVIDGDSSGTTVRFQNGEDSTAVLVGFTVQNGHGGGGIFCNYSDPIISNNAIRRNSAGNGGGIRCVQASPTINNNTISANSATGGGGIFCNDSDPIISNNTISGNSAGWGGGIYISYSYPSITNTILWPNVARHGPEIYFNHGSGVITYCDIRGGWEGEGNIDINPLFVDPYNGNYDVCSQSPCIDAGHPSMQDPDGTRSDIGVFYPEHPECSFGNIWYVSTSGNDATGDGSPGNPFKTIQYAIDVSFYSDTVIVQNGTYVETIRFYGKNVILASNYIFSRDTLDIQNTIIDGDSLSTVVSFVFCDSLAAITGFTIRNGSASIGGGIYCYGSNPAISNNTITGNSTPAGGGGLNCYLSNPRINNNAIRGNVADGYSGGGGIYCSFSNPAISSNTIDGNAATGYWGGGGISCAYSNPTVSNNVISGNSTALRGAGISCRYSDPTITNSTISRNSKQSSGGGALDLSDSSPSLQNCLIAFNTGGEPIRCGGNSNPILSCSDVFGNQGGDWVGCIADQADTNGNFSADPLFCDTLSGDYRISGASPCARANNSCGVLIGALDIGCGFVCGDLNNDTEVDIEDVYYLITHLFINGAPPECEPITACADVNLNGVVDVGDVVYLINYVLKGGPPPCE